MRSHKTNCFTPNQRKTKLEETIKELKADNVSKEVIENYETQLKEVNNEIEQDNKRIKDYKEKFGLGV